MASHLVLVRHGETEWSRSGQHTSFTDLPLLPEGIADASVAGEKLAAWSFSHVFSSPRQRALHTAELALPGSAPEITEDLTEWSYGDYEGITSPDIRKENPTWNLWRDGGPNGESPSEVTARCDRFIALVDGLDGDVVAFAHSHILRSLTARWIGQPVAFGASLMLDTASVSVLTVDRGTKVIKRWNQK